MELFVYKFYYSYAGWTIVFMLLVSRSAVFWLWYCARHLSCRALFQTAVSSCQDSREYCFATTGAKIQGIKRPCMASVANYRMYRFWDTLFVFLNVCVEHSRLRQVIHIMDRASLYCCRRYVHGARYDGRPPHLNPCLQRHARLQIRNVQSSCGTGVALAIVQDLEYSGQAEKILGHCWIHHLVHIHCPCSDCGLFRLHSLLAVI
jgi:hypothetical protein